MSTAEIAIVIALVAGFGGYKVSDWQHAYKELEREQQILVNVQQSAAAAIRKADNVIEATNAATARSVRLRSDLDASRSELSRLRDTIIAMPGSCPVGATGTTTDAGESGTHSPSLLLLECAGRHSAVAGVADRAINDAQTLEMAWPK